MKMRGGHNIRLAGEPADHIQVLPDPEVLYLPLHSRRLDFAVLQVKHDQVVQAGQLLATDPAHFHLPLLAPRAGRVDLNSNPGHLTLIELTKTPSATYETDSLAEFVPRPADSQGIRRYKLLALGAWPYFHDAHTGAIPDPFGTPGALLISAVAVEPFTPQSDTLLRNRAPSFLRGLSQMLHLIDDQQVVITLPAQPAELWSRIEREYKDSPQVRVVRVPQRYPSDNLRLQARQLGLADNPDRPVWAIRTAGVLAVDRALTWSKPVAAVTVTVGGPAATEPRHVRALHGYALADIFKITANGEQLQIIEGGVFTGSALAPERLGIDTEATAFTIMRRHSGKLFLGFMRPGTDRRSFSRCFLSRLLPGLPDSPASELRGERRPCIACGHCESSCPAGLLPQILHRFLYNKDIDDAAAAGLRLCVECGLCAYVCPSKLELLSEFRQAKQQVRLEQQSLADAAAAAAAADAAAEPGNSQLQ